VLFVLQDHSPEEIVPDRPGGVYRDGPVLRKPFQPHEWEIAIAGWTVPQWASVPGLILPGVLSAWGFVLAIRSDTGNPFPGVSI